MKLSIVAVLFLCIFQVNLAVADQYIYADADLDESTIEVADSTYNVEPYVYADADLDESTIEVADSTDNNVDSISGFADGKRVIST